jgi:hypothetical protein
MESDEKIRAEYGMQQLFSWTGRGLAGLLDLWEQWVTKGYKPEGDALVAVNRFLDRAIELRHRLRGEVE